MGARAGLFDLSPEELFELGFIEEQTIVVLLGPNGVGTTMISKNLPHRALLAGHTVQYTTASALTCGPHCATLTPLSKRS
jgi:hypothetical protein